MGAKNQENLKKTKLKLLYILQTTAVPPQNERERECNSQIF